MQSHTATLLRRLLAPCLCTFALASVQTAVAQPDAQHYPSRPIRVIVPTSPGSTADYLARLVGAELSQGMGQPVVVENMAGAGGIPGTRQLVSAAPDGYTLGIISSNYAVNPSLYRKMPYDSVKDITPISILGTTPLILSVPADSPYKTLQDLVAAAKAKPGSINYASSGKGTALHLAAELFRSRAGIDVVHIPYKGTNAMMTDIMAGQVQFGILASASALPQIRAGKMRALAVTTPRRIDSLPDVPTMAEAGVKDYAYDAWLALIAPAGLPKAVGAQLRAQAARALSAPKVREALASQGLVAVASSEEEADRTIRGEIVRSAALIRAAGVVAE